MERTSISVPIKWNNESIARLLKPQRSGAISHVGTIFVRNRLISFTLFKQYGWRSASPLFTSDVFSAGLPPSYSSNL